MEPHSILIVCTKCYRLLGKPCGLGTIAVVEYEMTATKIKDTWKCESCSGVAIEVDARNYRVKVKELKELEKLAAWNGELMTAGDEAKDAARNVGDEFAGNGD